MLLQLRSAHNVALYTSHHVNIVTLGVLNSLFGHKGMDRAGCGYCFWCRDKLLVCISVLGLLLVFCEFSARQSRPDRCYACQLRCPRSLRCHGSKLCYPLMRRGHSRSWRKRARSRRGDRPCQSRGTVTKHYDEKGYIMRYERNEQLLLNAEEGKQESSGVASELRLTSSKLSSSHPRKIG